MLQRRKITGMEIQNGAAGIFAKVVFWDTPFCKLIAVPGSGEIKSDENDSRVNYLLSLRLYNADHVLRATGVSASLCIFGAYGYCYQFLEDCGSAVKRSVIERWDQCQTISIKKENGFFSSAPVKRAFFLIVLIGLKFLNILSIAFNIYIRWNIVYGKVFKMHQSETETLNGGENTLKQH